MPPARALMLRTQSLRLFAVPVSIAIASAGCTPEGTHHYGPPMLCLNVAEGGLVSLEPYFYFGELRSYRYRDRYGVERHAKVPLTKDWRCPKSSGGGK